MLSNCLTLSSSFLHLLVYVTLIFGETIVYPSFEHSKQSSSTLYPKIISRDAVIDHGYNSDIEIDVPTYASPQLGPVFRIHVYNGQFMLSLLTKKLSQDPIISDGEVELNSNLLSVIASSLTLRSCVWHLLVWVTVISFETMVVPSFEHSKQNCSSLYPNKVSRDAFI